MLSEGYGICCLISGGASPPGSRRSWCFALPSEMLQPTLTGNKVNLGE